MIRTLLVSIALGLTAIAPAIASDAPKSRQAKPVIEVIMYSTATCGYCEKARQWFTSHNVAWDERDVEKSADARAQWQGLGGVGTPMILINGKRFNGFVERALEAEIAKYR